MSRAKTFRLERANGSFVQGRKIEETFSAQPGQFLTTRRIEKRLATDCTSCGFRSFTGWTSISQPDPIPQRCSECDGRLRAATRNDPTRKEPEPT